MRALATGVFGMRRLGPLCGFHEPMLQRRQLAKYRVLLTTSSTASENAALRLHQLGLGSTDMQHTRP